MKVLIPMSGAGARFKNAGYVLPKPLIKVDGAPMVEHLANMFYPADEFIFICNSEHLGDKSLGLEKILKGIRPDAEIVSVEPHKKGPNYSLLKTAKFLDANPVFVSYCDFALCWDETEFLKKVGEFKPDSASVCYKGFHPHLLGPNLFAGVRTDDRNFALEVREKYSFTPNTMDTWQQAGLFWFSSGNILKKYLERAWAENWTLNGESYTSLLFNPMMADGLSSLVYPAEFFCQWGTPEDLEEYEAWSRLFAKEFGRGKGKTDIPAGREANVKIKLDSGSDEYKKSYDYWKEYFLKCRPVAQK